MSGERRAAVRPPVATLPACEPRRDKTKKWIDHSLKQEVDSTLTRAFFYSKTNLASPSNCPIEPDHLSPPSYRDIREATKEKLIGNDVNAGWRLEYFVNSHFISCKEGLIDDSPNFELLHTLMSQKSSPVSSAISITFDLND